MDLSVMFFGSESSVAPAEKYDDVMAIAMAADRLGFRAVWTPERHFQEFGQVFPNPALLGAALAMVTERVEIRAGSVVLPLHHPLRVMEDWSVVDNLSRGRVGFSVATGWHARDFVLAPGHYADRRDRAHRDIATLRRLWSGEPGTYEDGAGELVEVLPQPRPFSGELPLWLTTSGTPATWVAAGELRTGILAGSIGLNRPALETNIKNYRRAYEGAGDVARPGSRGVVTLMMHAYVAGTESAVRDRVREPLGQYIRSYVAQASSNRSLAEDRAMASLSEADQRRMVDFAFERYMSENSLLGTPDRCRKTMADMRDLGVDEIACFVDFGLERDEILDSLELLSEIGASVS
ncbi:MupA/Atu3671 family FMN-dependent luciferase-like monooxygenase [Streptosporangium sp. NPDC048865]|uniref:MupA/Atu3671 family FMN-dependent luciferase-like monooxygenase n=1 Tax=Streptosporangium sp. NPDC048865 TaxID=3155766 RepID=UPI003427B04A